MTQHVILCNMVHESAAIATLMMNLKVQWFVACHAEQVSYIARGNEQAGSIGPQ